MLNRLDVATESRVQTRRLVGVQLEAHRHVERNRLPFLAVDVDLVVVRRAFRRRLRQHERLHEDGIFFDSRRQRILQVQPRSERRFVNATAGPVNHDPHISRIHVHDCRRQQHERDDEHNDQPEHATDLVAQIAATVQAAEVHRRQTIADRATH